MGARSEALSKWPKQRPELTPEQQRILEDWYEYWLGVQPDRFNAITKFNNRYPLRSSRSGIRTLEIGAGIGGHLSSENLARQEYYAMELRTNLVDEIKRLYPKVHTIVGDCERRIDLPNGFVDRVIAIHVLEHLERLPSALEEVRRVLKPGGNFCIVIPCEGGLGYALGRKITSRRIFEKRYKQGYDWIIEYEHINRAGEIITELSTRFAMLDRQFWPLGIPSIHANLLLGMTLRPL